MCPSPSLFVLWCKRLSALTFLEGLPLGCQGYLASHTDEDRIGSICVCLFREVHNQYLVLGDPKPLAWDEPNSGHNLCSGASCGIRLWLGLGLNLHFCLAPSPLFPLPLLPYWFILGLLLYPVICTEPLAQGLSLEELELRSANIWENMDPNVLLFDVRQSLPVNYRMLSICHLTSAFWMIQCLAGSIFLRYTKGAMRCVNDVW